MELQKPTILDAARIAAELLLLKGAVIRNAVLNHPQSSVLLALDMPERCLLFKIESKYTMLATVLREPMDMTRAIPILSGYIITSARQINNDRIVAINLEKEDRLGRLKSAILVFEIIPNKGNMILTDESGAVKWSLKDRQSDIYQPPSPLKKPTVLNFRDEQIEPQTADIKSAALQLYGLNDRDLLTLEAGNYGSFADTVGAIREYAVRAATPGPAWIVYRKGQIAGYTLVEPHLLPEENAVKIKSALEMYGVYYEQAAGQIQEQERREALLLVLDKEIKIQKAKLSSLEKELAAAEQAGILRLYGELLLANIENIPKGSSGIHLRNFEGNTPEFVNISLDPSKGATANADDYFRKYKKSISSIKVLERRRQATLEKLRALDKALEKASDNIELLESELRDLGLIARESGKPAKRVVEPRLPYKKFVASNGWEILVGRTNAENDELTFHIAQKDDYWFHAWQAAGSHTVLRLPNKQAEPDKRILLEAASLAAYYSKAKSSSKVPVAYTQVRFVRKPRNFPPGKVLIEREKQLMVKPANPDDYLPKG